MTRVQLMSSAARLMPCVALLVLFPTIDAASPLAVSVSTTSGNIAGVRQTVGSTGAAVWQFLGIPYAEPPTGDRRFARPVPLKTKRERIRNVQPPACPQPLVGSKLSLSEDCLYLNVWSPVAKSERSRGLPVMVYIHGGVYFKGAASLYNGAVLSGVGNTVVVVMQYRLGVLGFLRLDSHLVTGNWGLFDQRLALQWVKDNARAFGGDPDAITIFGQSAGSTSVSLHLFSNHSTPLFHRAILQSGTLLTSWAINTNARAVEAIHRNLVGKFFNCSQEIAKERLACLRKLPKEAFDKVLLYSLMTDMTAYLFSPVMDGIFFSEDPEKMVKRGQVPHKPIMMGVTSDEMPSILLLNMKSNPATQKIAYNLHDLKGQVLNRFIHGIAKYYPRFPTRTPNQIIILLQKLGSSQNDPTNGFQNFKQLVDLIQCPFIYSAVNEFADLYRNASSAHTVFLYEFAHVNSFVKTTRWMGALHGSDVEYVFGIPLLLPAKYTAAEVNLSRTMVNDWTTFAKLGRPRSSKWQASVAPKRQYLRFALPITDEKYWIKRERCSFWDIVLPYMLSSQF